MKNTNALFNHLLPFMHNPFDSLYKTFINFVFCVNPLIKKTTSFFTCKHN